MIDFSNLTKEAAKNSAADELGVSVGFCDFEFASDCRGQFLRAFCEGKGFSSKYYYSR